MIETIKRLRYALVCLVVVMGMILVDLAPPAASAQVENSAGTRVNTGGSIYLPLVQYSPPPVLRVNAPYLVPWNQDEMAIFWLGRVNSTENYTDVRVAYTQTEVVIKLATFDKRLWYNPNPTPQDMPNWDSASLYLNLKGNLGNQPGSSAYQFIGQLNWWESRANFQAAYQGNGSTWNLAPIAFTTETGWRGDNPNDDVDDRGWVIVFHLPYASLGLSAPPPQGTTWGLGIRVHDRDAKASGPNPDQAWPPAMSPDRPATWGQLEFGLPGYTPPPGLVDPQTFTLRNGLNGVQVSDGMVGGSSVCGEGLDYWTQWGEKNYAGSEFFNVQNESDISDWPCFSKDYLTFPLSSLPAGKTVISASLTLHLMGNAGGGQWGPSPVSLVQIMTTAQDWNESTLNWNNAPLANENVSRAWVNPIAPGAWPGSPGVAYSWDLSYAIDKAYRAGTPLRLVIYSADGGYNSGRYFTSSHVGDWDAAGRPTLNVILGTP